MIESKIKAVIKDIKDFPKPGIVFKDITPILLDSRLCSDITDAFLQQIPNDVDAICAIESRGFFFGTLLANKLGVPFIPVRKAGKLPGDTISYTYDLEYGSSTIEVHDGDIKSNWKVLIHDDLLATGGTALAAAELVKRQGAEVAAFSFLVTLDFLGGIEALKTVTPNIISLAKYN